jgi:hypothetical protein
VTFHCFFLPSDLSNSASTPLKRIDSKTSRAALIFNPDLVMADIPSSAPVRIGTRRSKLAIVQAEGIRDSLQKIDPDRSFEIEALSTLGDKDQKTALYNFGAKSLWTTELEELLNTGRLDVVVHCLKGEFHFRFKKYLTISQTCQPNSPTPVIWQPFPSAMIPVTP